MLHIRDYMSEDKLFEALDSKIRRNILHILINDGPKNLDQLARHLGVTNGALTTHIRLLEQVHLIKTEFVGAKRGLSKMCPINTNRIVIDLLPIEKKAEKSRETDIDIGLYGDYMVLPTCGLVTKDGPIGKFDEPRFFAYQERTKAALLWFGIGYVEYIVPNLLKEGEMLSEIQFVFEIASEAPGFMEFYPSDIHFWLNDKCLGYWTIDGEKNDRRGLFTPDWWDRKLGQYGIIYILSLNNTGAYLNGYDLCKGTRNGKQIGGYTLRDFLIDSHSDIRFKIGVPDDTENRGGLSLFGKGFGDYNRGITCRMVYMSDADSRSSAKGNGSVQT